MDRIYRGMSDLELKCWVDKGGIPKETNFSLDPEEAINLGIFYLINGNLIIFSPVLEDYYIPINNTSPEGKKGFWYKTERIVQLDEITDFEIYSPQQLLGDIEREQKYKKPI